MKAQIEITEIRHDLFEGIVNSSELSNAFRAKHGINPNTELLLGGDIIVEWDDDLPMPHVNRKELAIRLPGTTSWVSIKEEELDVDSVDKVLESQDFSEWYEDRDSYLADYYVDLDR